MQKSSRHRLTTLLLAAALVSGVSACGSIEQDSEFAVSSTEIEEDDTQPNDTAAASDTTTVAKPITNEPPTTPAEPAIDLQAIMNDLDVAHDLINSKCGPDPYAEDKTPPPIQICEFGGLQKMELFASEAEATEAANGVVNARSNTLVHSLRYGEVVYNCGSAGGWEKTCIERGKTISASTGLPAVGNESETMQRVASTVNAA